MRLLHRSCRRGTASAELVIAAPVLLLMLLLIVQFALWSHATHIAQSAAARALDTARVQDGSADAGTASAQRILDQLAKGPLRDSIIHTDRTATTVTVQIRGTASAVVPFLRLPVHAEAAGPVERFEPQP
jgi:Flp pilus assembly protein TadG